MRRLVRLETQNSAVKACRRIGRVVEDPNLRGWAALVPGASTATAHVIRAGLGRSRVLVLEGREGVGLLGDPFALFTAGRELAALEHPEVRELGEWLSKAAENADGQPAAMRVGRRTFDWSAPVVMGIVNVTSDSFSDGGRYLDPQQAIEHGLRLVEEGAELLDVGGESTRPRGATYGEGARTVSIEEEIARVVPVVKGLAARTEVPISIDTRKAEVARAALEAGAVLVNDVSGLLHDEALAQVAAEFDAALCLMHTPRDIESLSHEEPSTDVIGEVLGGLERSVARALERGVKRERLLVDPGIGFGKTQAGNLALLRHLESVAALGFPLLVGASRKSSIGRAASADGEPLPVDQRQAASVGAAVTAWLRGAHVLRVHDVRPTVEALRVAQAIRG